MLIIKLIKQKKKEAYTYWIELFSCFFSTTHSTLLSNLEVREYF